MANLKDIKKRIVSVKNTQQITKAMKMVSAAKLRRAQEAVVAARPYAEKMQDVLSSLAKREEADAHPLLVSRGKGRALLITLTADRGLCGGFNATIIKAAEKFSQDNPEGYEDIDLMVIGKKGVDVLKRRSGVSIAKTYENITGAINYSTAQMIAEEVIGSFNDEKYDSVYILFNAFVSAMTQNVTLQKVLPVVPEVSEDDAHAAEYIYEPTQHEVLEQILQKSVEVQIFRALLESVASEHGSRMSSMDSASRNASEMIGKLTLIYNRVRQAAITNELMEIISGAESIK